MIAIQAQLTSYDAVTHVHEHDSKVGRWPKDQTSPNCVCLCCGIRFHVSPGRIKRDGGKYCSMKCRIISKRAISEHNKIKRTCLYCNKQFWVVSSALKQSAAKYCSHVCQGKDKTKKAKLIRPEFTCAYCGKRFKRILANVRNGRMLCCSKSCSNKFKVSRIHINCTNCGKDIEVTNGDMKLRKHHYCSFKCFHEYQRGKNHPLWNNDATHSRYCHKFNESLKEEIRAKFGFKCFFCGSLEGLKKHAVHHVDYNKVQGCKGMKWALIPLDHKCHLKTNSHRWYWFCLLRDYWVYGQYEGFELWVPDKSYFRKGGKR